MKVHYFAYYGTNASYHRRETDGYGVDAYVSISDARIMHKALRNVANQDDVYCKAFAQAILADIGEIEYRPETDDAA